MQFDDRLATVLRTPARTEAGARTQYRQLIDLLGSLRADAAGALVEAAYERLEALADELPAAVQSHILRGLGLRLRSSALLARLALGEPQAAAAAMATAQLGESEWLALIPRLPVTARGFLRHRRDLPQSARQVLQRLGVTDLALPQPSGVERPIEGQPPPPKAPTALEEAPSEAERAIGDMVGRIQASQRTRRDRARPVQPAAEPRLAQFDFATDASGTIMWADAAFAPLVVGITLGASGPTASAHVERDVLVALARRLPLGGALTLDGPDAIAGAWRIDASPRFNEAGSYTGHLGRMRRAPPPATGAPSDTPGDRMRQVLHELRTPVNAVQGFAEIIQQQLFGPAPHEYRALAGAVAVDAARLMAGFDELDRLARLESGALAMEDGASDVREVLSQLLRRVEGVLRPRSARVMLVVEGAEFTVPLAADDIQQLAWRLVATLAGALAPGEVIELNLSAEGERVRLKAELPAALLEDADMFAAIPPAQPRALSAGMFGSGFAFRLARAEAAAAGGSLVREDDMLTLELPALTAPAAQAQG